MKLAQTFQAVEETQFLQQLSSQDYLFFVGETEILTYIKTFFSTYKQNDHNYYYDLANNSLDNLFENQLSLEQYRAVIVASFKNEESLFIDVKQQAIRRSNNIVLVRLFADIFVNFMCKRELLQTAAAQLVKPQKSYAIVTTPRSGSTYLCNLLDSIGIAGHPTEHLRQAAQELTRNCNFDYLKLLHNLMQYRTSINGVFGTKLISHFLFQLGQLKHGFGAIFAPIDKVILLSRGDKVAQAVSLIVAQKTEIWHLSHHISDRDSGNQRYQAKLDNIDINDALLAEVDQKHQFLIAQEARLNKILLAQKIEPLRIVYEDIVAAPKSQIEHILDYLEIARPEGFAINASSRVKKMPAKISQKIIEQYTLSKSTVSKAELS